MISLILMWTYFFLLYRTWFICDTS